MKNNDATLHPGESRAMNYFAEVITEKIRISPLSYSQQQMWIIDRMQPGNHAYNLPAGYRLKGIVDIPVLEKSFNEIIKRHESLRTTFSIIKEQPVQLIHPEYNIKIKVIDIKDIPDSQKEKKADFLATEEAVAPFDLTSLPLIRVILINLNEFDHVLIVNMHHIISDGWSLGIILSELSLLYNSAINNSLPELPVLETQYSDFVRWQNEKNWKPGYEEQLDFWKETLKGELPPLELPADKQRPSVQNLNGSNEFFFLADSVIKKIQSAGFKKGCTFYMTILSVFQAFLHRYSGNDDVVIGTPVSNRPRKNDENLVGNYINTVAIRVNVGDDPLFTDLLQRTRKLTIDVLTNRDFPFEKIVEHLKIRRDLSRNPVFQVMLQVLPKHSFNLEGLEISNFNFDFGYSQFDLSLHLYQLNDGYQCRIEYNTDLFEAGTISRMKSNFIHFLNQIIINPAQKISQIPLLSDEEKNLVMVEWNKTKRDFPGSKTLIDLFEEMVENSKNKPAVQWRNKILSYAELNSNANLIADYLLKKNVKAGDLAGICMDRSADMVCALLGILKTGAAYLPLDPSFPAERLRFILEDAGVSLVLTQSTLTNIFPGYKGQVVNIDSEWEEIKNGNASDKNVPVGFSDTAYIIYTSGSSGKPKGVMIPHRAVVNFLVSMMNKPGLKADDVLLAVTTISFDISVLEIFLPLVTGAKVIIASRNETVDGTLLIDKIKKNNVTVMQATPSTWKLMIEAGWNYTPGLKVLCGGEALPRDLADKILDRCDELWNMYGPTETTVWSSVKKIESGSEPVYIGGPIANTQFYVVDKYINPVPAGVPGELLIGGEGLAKGYLNRSDLTGEKFINDPFNNSGGRLYRTGDLVRFRSDGEIEYSGRTDFQIKLRGYRIEPGEIENHLCSHSDIKEAVVTLQQNINNDRQLTAYIIPETGKDISLVSIKNYLKENLPDYMIPSVFVKMENFPHTPNGKIDRKALPSPDSGRINPGTSFTAPQTELQKKIASIWKSILAIESVGIHDNFFDLGGHSLSAVQMLSGIEKETGIKLPLITLFSHQDIYELSSVIESGNWKDKWSSLIQMKKGTRTPLFLIHGAEGNILVYKDLARHLDPEQSFFALQSKGLDGLDDTYKSIEEMASFYIKEIKKVQPDGPYNLGGYCMGGTIAYEMALQLTRMGEKVKNIFLVETYNICIPGKEINNKMTWVDKIENIRFHIQNLRSLKTADRIKFLNNKSEVLKRRVISRIINVMQKLGIEIRDTEDNIKATHKIRVINDAAQSIYTPKKYSGKVVLLKPRVNYSSAPDPKFGWEHLLQGEFKIYNLDIAPRGMLYEPFVKQTAEIITREMNL